MGPTFTKRTLFDRAANCPAETRPVCECYLIDLDYDVMGVKVSTIMGKIHRNMHVLCLHVKNLHESTKTCMFPCITEGLFNAIGSLHSL